MYKQNKSRGWIELITGPMFSGKSEELIRRVKRAKIAKQNVLVYKPKIDDRYSKKEEIVSHDGNTITCKLVNDFSDIIKMTAEFSRKKYVFPEVVAIDEIQFFDYTKEYTENRKSLIEILNNYAYLGIRVIVTGLDLDFKGDPFPPVPNLMAIAEQVDKLTAICDVCGNLASRTQRYVDGEPAKRTDPIILVGAKDEYGAVCRDCHKVLD